ncbi:hypothetical protein GCM10011514_20830 [Emticicia aquatilis]|uniref:YdhG-like domain-containing protein n=1 Tax=Emticicia aquatilis TaxID=1537369 RepID=A0A916YRG4_9BACT|nr:DUF1801 domain-containing protein [Emticicia aquatilis]GGD56584.1 hypothetical protein GCM10011514_20830 [Emticicia aquatilis]
MNKYISIENFIESQEPLIATLMSQLRVTILNAHPKMIERFMFNTAMFGVKNEFCYFVVLKKNAGIEVGFHRGFQMSNEQGLLESKKRKFIHGVTFRDLEDFKKKEASFKEILQEAIILDDINEKSIFSEILQAGRKKKS